MEQLKMLVYGEPGVGKTRFVSTAAADERLGPCLMLEAKGNPISIRTYAKKPDIVTIREMADFNDPYEWLRDGQDPSHPWCVEHQLHPPYKMVIVDSLTEVQRAVMRVVTGSAKWQHPGDLAPSLERRGFGQLLGTMLNWANFYLELPMHVVLTCHERIVGGDGEVKQVVPLLWGQSGNELAGFCFMVMRLLGGLNTPAWMRTWQYDPVTDNTQNVGLFRETLQYYAKDQYGIKVDHLTDPTMSKVADLIEQSGQPES